MTPTPTSPDRPFAHVAHATLTAALDAAAHFDTGLNLYGLRGELVEALPYAELRSRAQALAADLMASGLSPGDRVGLVAETSADFVVRFFACQYARLVPATLPLPAALAGRDGYVEQVARLLSAADASAVFGPESLSEWLAEAAERAGLRAPSPTPAAPAPSSPEPGDPCYLQFSSGSTREPAGVLVTHRALTANALAITRDGLKVTAADRAVSWLPLFHDMGFVGFLLSPLFAGMSVDLLPTEGFVRRPLLWPTLMSQNGGTVSYSPTFGYSLAARRAETAHLSGLDLSRWRVAGVGGDMVRTESLGRFAERFAAAGFSDRAYVASYGMAEATLALTMAPLGQGVRAETLAVERMERTGEAAEPAPGERARTFVRCGRVLPGHELEVRGPSGVPLPERRVGEVFVRGPSLMEGYFRRPDATAAVLSADGWLDTGDLGFLIDGEVTITGRSKDLILLNGRNVWPQDLEWTAESEVVGLRGGDVAAFAAEEGLDHDVTVLVQARSSDPEKRVRLVEEVAHLLHARHGVQAEVRLVGAHALPQTSSGKLSRSKARALHRSGALDALKA